MEELSTLYQTFSWLRQSSPKDATFSSFNNDYEIKGSDVMNKLKKQDMLSLVKLNQASCNSNMFLLSLCAYQSQGKLFKYLPLTLRCYLYH
jgi:hypothetical protein